MIVLALSLAFLSASPSRAQTVTTAYVTYYDLSGKMANGDYVHDGAAACPKRYLGATVTILEVNLTFECDDTGDPSWFENGEFKLDVWYPYRPGWLSEGDYTIVINY